MRSNPTKFNAIQTKLAILMLIKVRIVINHDHKNMIIITAWSLWYLCNINVRGKKEWKKGWERHWRKRSESRLDVCTERESR